MTAVEVMLLEVNQVRDCDFNEKNHEKGKQTPHEHLSQGADESVVKVV